MSLAVICFIWNSRNKIIHEERSATFSTAKQGTLTHIKEAAPKSKGVMKNNVQDLRIISKLGVIFKPRKPPDIKACFWELPVEGIIKANTDGASRGNPGRAGYGIMFRDYTGSVMEVPTKNIRTATSFMADCTEILAAAERAYHKGWHILLIESDSKAAVDSFNHSCMPRQLEPKWRF
ncbi:hypothetical protein GIB67_003886 [Kingdonia uniflora]|uniref:RNase H type-1 domain-containing protein n=1 Tax=Kingdonia uniflora TaxID=39325 RepID=A0A7J7LK74_9MAGN|nr:hypothetical protein GIB67_003886 [Kingdonia uniflora]